MTRLVGLALTVVLFPLDGWEVAKAGTEPAAVAVVLGDRRADLPCLRSQVRQNDVVGHYLTQVGRERLRWSAEKVVVTFGAAAPTGCLLRAPAGEPPRNLDRVTAAPPEIIDGQSVLDCELADLLARIEDRGPAPRCLHVAALPSVGGFPGRPIHFWIPREGGHSDHRADTDADRRRGTTAGRVPEDPLRKTALVAGGFYLITFISSIPAVFPIDPVLNHSWKLGPPPC
jgi:hypothetical protein